MDERPPVPTLPPATRESIEENFHHLVAASKALLGVLETDRLLEVLMEKAIELTRAERGFLMLADPAGELRFRVGRRFDRSLLDTSEAVISRSVVDEVYRTRSPILSANALGDDALRNRQSVFNLRLMTVICAPVIAQDRVLGVLYVDSHRVRPWYDASSLAAFQALADFAAIALENARLYELATSDSRTGLANAGLFRSRLDSELAAAAAAGRGLGLILADLDHFKSINDTHGHPAGDRVLVEVARLLRRAARPQDLAARVGGEEFALLVTAGSEGLPDLVEIAERVRATVAAHCFSPGDGAAIAVTTSVGAARFPAPGIACGDDLIAAADRLLYQAKRRGRNRVESDCEILAATH